MNGIAKKTGGADMGAKARYLKLNIRELRNKKGLTQEDLAEKMGITKACLCRWENWEHESEDPVPSLRTLARIAAALNVRVKDLFDEN